MQAQPLSDGTREAIIPINARRSHVAKSFTEAVPTTSMGAKK